MVDARISSVSDNSGAIDCYVTARVGQAQGNERMILR